MKILGLCVLILTVVWLPAFAQEICDNGIDDDGDGFVDCYDSDCAGTAFCSSSFVFPTASCTVPPPAAPAFTMRLKFATDKGTANNTSRVSVGDLDRDGVPEIVTMNKGLSKIFILNGQTGAIKYQKDVPFQPGWEGAIANIDNDNCGEIFFYGLTNTSSGPAHYIYAYDCQLNFLWRSSNFLPTTNLVTPALADFDGDGKVELYVKNYIFDAHTGNCLVCDGTIWDQDDPDEGSLAIDITGDENLELIQGLSIYQVDLSPTRAPNSGAMTLLKKRDEYYLRSNVSGSPSVADYNQDGYLDILTSGSLDKLQDNTTIFFWDVHNDNLLTYSDNNSKYGPIGWWLGTGRLNIGDLDGDGKLNASFVSASYLYALKEDFTLLWRTDVTDISSGITGCTLFDFNGDGKTEIVYRDERNLYIINGTDGAILSSQICSSLTSKDYPVVADVDADGSTELCVTCGFVDGDNSIPNSHVRVFQSAAEPWVPARRLWNQHGYFVVNVNDDLTIPRRIQKHHLVWSSNQCSPGTNRPLNKFLNQAPYLDTRGCPIYAAPDLAFASAPVVNPPTCPDLNFTVSFSITNRGDMPLTGSVPISFYSSNPSRPGATRLNTTKANVNLKKNEILQLSNIVVNGIGSDSVYIVLNDAGTTVPTPITLPNTSFLECNYDNIIGAPVNPLPVKLTALNLSPNSPCTGTPSGVAQAYVNAAAGVQDITNYFFYWSNGTVAKSPASADFVGASYTGLTDGTYTVYAIHKTANCSSDTLQIIINLGTASIPDVSIQKISDQTSCSPPNGALQAIVAGGNAGYTFSWEDAGAPLGINTALIQNQKAGSYTVIVKSPGGCTGTADGVILDQIQEPTLIATATDITNCLSTNSGAVSASASVAGVTLSATNVVYNWYFYDNPTGIRGSLLPAINGPAGSSSRTDLATGYYQVEAVDKTTGCVSSNAPVVQVTSNITLPTVDLNVTSPQLSCNPATPTGSLLAQPRMNGIAEPLSSYTFEWFDGTNTTLPLPAANIAGVNAEMAIALKGNQSYTVRVTNKTTGCTGTNFSPVSENIQQPSITATKSDNTICKPTATAPAYTGSITLTLTFNGATVTDLSDYQITWYDGTTPDPMKIRTSDSGKLAVTNLATGSYTVSATNTRYSCSSNILTIAIKDISILPVIAGTTQPSTVCLPLLPGVTPDGALSVQSVNGNTNLVGYSFQWYSAADTTGTKIIGATASSLTNRLGGTTSFFTVLATDINTGCATTKTLQLPDNHQIPVINVSTTDNDACTTTNGSASLSQIDYKGTTYLSNFSAFTYSWSSGETIEKITGKSAGTYSLTVTNTADGCVSNPVSGTILDNQFIPPVTLIPSNQTSCDGLSPNGALIATVNESTIGGNAAENNSALYKFDWADNGNPFNPTGTTLISSSAVNGNITGLPGNRFYSVTATRVSTGCKSVQTVFIQDLSGPIQVAATGTPVTQCAPPNGSAQANVNGQEAGYTFYWLRETGATQTTQADQVIATATQVINGSGLYANLIPGKYTVVAVNNTTTCTSSPLTLTIADATPVIDLTVNTSPLPTACNVAGGAMTAAATGGSGVYTFDWYEGGPVNTFDLYATLPIFSPPAPIGTSTSLTNLTSGIYSVLATDQTTGCKALRTTTLPFVNAVAITEVATPSTTCLATGNGQLSVNVNLPALTTLNDYVFRIYAGTNATAANQIGTDITTATMPLTFNNLKAGFYAIEVEEQLSGNKCKSTIVTEVEQGSFQPLLNVASITPNNACDLTQANGSLQLKIDRDPKDIAATYNYSVEITPAPVGWTNPTNTGNIAASSMPYTLNVTGLEPSRTVPVYSVTIEETSSGCSNQIDVTSPDQPPFVAIVDPITILPALACDPILEKNALGEIVAIQNNGVNDDLSTYEFSWYTDASLTNAIVSNAPGDSSPVKGGEILSNVGAPLPSQPVTAGEYWVVATKRSIFTTEGGVGCDANPTQVIIPDGSRNPQALLTTIQPNTACDTNSDGALQVVVTNPGSVASSDYSYTFLQEATPIITPASSNGDGLLADDNFTNLSDGVYEVQIRNNNSGCLTTALTNLQKKAVSVAIDALATTPQLLCKPDGSVSVTSITIDGAPQLLASFVYIWYRDVVTPGQVIVLPASGNSTLDVTDIFVAPATMGAGTYFVTATNQSGGFASGCAAAPVSATVLDISVNPTVSLVTTLNGSCTLTPLGAVAISASDASGPGAGAQYSYTILASIGNPLNGTTYANNNGNGINDLPDNDFIQGMANDSYTFFIKNQVTDCVESASTVVTSRIFTPAITQTQGRDPVDCLPSGAAWVVAVNDGQGNTFTAPTSDLSTLYNFTWFVSSVQPANQLPATNDTLQNISPETYLVNATDLITGCSSPYAQVTISPDAIRYPAIVATQHAPQVICNTLTLGGSGAIRVMVDLTELLNSRTNYSNYDFTWYSGATTGGTIIPTPVDSLLSNLTTGAYTVEVYDHTTQCRTTSSFIIPDNSADFDPTLSLSTSPVTLCTLDDGVLLATTTDPTQIEGYAFPYPFAVNFGAELFAGINPNLNGPPDYVMTQLLPTSFTRTNLSAGDYTVRLTDLNTGCQVVKSTSLLDDRNYPNPVVTTLSPITNCDATRPNGAAAIKMTDGVTNYNFLWYEGTSATGTLVHTGPDYTELKPEPIIYTVDVTDLRTGCKGQTQASFKFTPVAIPSPEIDILSSVTSCITGNGQLRASIDGDSRSYIFEWYNSGTPTGTPDFVGELYTDLSAGTYSVTATSIFTGCKSPWATADLGLDQETPLIAFETHPASCNTTNGFALLSITSNTPIADVEWRDAQGSIVGVGPNLTEVLPGIYTVTVTTIEGCVSDLEIEIDAEIRPHNGISRNFDNKNELFYIDCIENFPNNLVQIFNRAGTLVYEAHDYNNTDVYFNGRSNRGVSPMGQDLPDGTYFYIIDKRNGSKPLAGYLEIVK